MVGNETSLALMDVIFAQRDDPTVSASFGSEQTDSSGFDGDDTYRYAYDGDGAMAIEVVEGVTTTLYVGNVYEYEDDGSTVTQRKYYYAGSVRVGVNTKVGAGAWTFS